jgi:hypothetical protein
MNDIAGQMYCPLATWHCINSVESNPMSNIATRRTLQNRRCFLRAAGTVLALPR